MAKETMDHITPDLTPKYDQKKAEAAAKKVESLREEESELVEKLKDVRKEIAVQSAAARLGFSQPGFSNAASAKEQTAANKETQKENAATSAATKK